MSPLPPAPPERRMRALALALGTPALLAMLGLTALEAWRLVHPTSPLFVPPPAASLADAIAADDAAAAYEFIRGGQDPNQPVFVMHEELTGGRRVEVPPLVWAVAADSRASVAMLFGLAPTPDPTIVRDARCLAERLGREDIEELILLVAPAAASEPCADPAAAADGAALLTAR